MLLQIVEQQKSSLIACGNEKWYSHLGREFSSFLQKLHIALQYDLIVVLLLGIYRDLLKTYVHTEICTRKFKAALLITAPNWRQDALQ